MGVYANIFTVDDVSIGLGYTGMLRSFAYYIDKDNDYVRNIAMTYKSPYWSGIDLRFIYSGLQGLIINSNHNFSFTAVNGTNDTNNTVYGIYYIKMDDSDTLKESWFAMMNSLALAYKITDRFTVNLQIANRYGKYGTTEKGKNGGSVSTNVLAAALYGTYSIANVILEGGISLRNTAHRWTWDTGIRSNMYTWMSETSGNAKANILAFSIPVRIRIAL